MGLTRDEVLDLRHVMPGVRFAVDAYVNFARRAPWQEAVCSSLTELFAPEIHKQRLANWPEHYPWIEPDGPGTTSAAASARRGATSSRAWRSRWTTSPRGAQQERALEVLQFKLDILWAMNDAMALRYGVTAHDGAVSLPSQPRVGPGFRLQWEPAQDCHVLLYPEGMVKLNGSAGEIMKRCDGERSVAAIVAELEQAFDRTRARGRGARVRRRWRHSSGGWRGNERAGSNRPSARRCGCWRS